MEEFNNKFFNKTIGKLGNAENNITLKDYVRLNKASNFLGRIWVQLDLYVFHGKGWLTVEKSNQLIDQIKNSDLSKMLSECNQILNSGKDIKNLTLKNAWKKEVSDLYFVQKLLKVNYNNRLNLTRSNLDWIKELSFEQMLGNKILNEKFTEFNDSVFSSNTLELDPKKFKDYLKVRQYRTRMDSLFNADKSYHAFIQHCFIEWAIDQTINGHKKANLELDQANQINDHVEENLGLDQANQIKNFGNKFDIRTTKVLLNCILKSGVNNFTLDIEKEKIHISLVKKIDQAETRYLLSLKIDASSEADAKIQLELNEKGQVLSLLPYELHFLDPNLFERNWGDRFSKIFDHLLKNNACSHSTFNVMRVHPLSLVRIPEVILRSLCVGEKFKEPWAVDFLSDELHMGAGLDRGGLSRQFMSQLSQNLVLSLPRLNQENLCDLGRLLSACFQNEELSTGRVLPDHFFKLLQNIMRISKPSDIKLSNEQMASVLDQSLFKDNLDLTIFMAWKYNLSICTPCEIKVKAGGKEKITTIETMLVDICYLVDRDEDPQFFDEDGKVKKEMAQELMLMYLLEVAEKEIQKAFNISKGITLEQKNEMLKITSEELNEKIQGKAFSREEIASLVTCSSYNPVVMQKAKWLQEFILDENHSEDWVLDLIENVTGERAILAGTKINIQESPDNLCHSFTCFNYLQVPTRHVNLGTDQNEMDLVDQKKLFFNNLKLTLSQKGFDGR